MCVKESSRLYPWHCMPSWVRQWMHLSVISKYSIQVGKESAETDPSKRLRFFGQPGVCVSLARSDSSALLSTPPLRILAYFCFSVDGGENMLRSLDGCHWMMSLGADYKPLMGWGQSVPKAGSTQKLLWKTNPRGLSGVLPVSSIFQHAP